jgi:hypothetical protein
MVRCLQPLQPPFKVAVVRAGETQPRLVGPLSGTIPETGVPVARKALWLPWCILGRGASLRRWKYYLGAVQAGPRFQASEVGGQRSKIRDPRRRCFVKPETG